MSQQMSTLKIGECLNKQMSAKDSTLEKISKCLNQQMSMASQQMSDQQMSVGESPVSKCQISACPHTVKIVLILDLWNWNSSWTGYLWKKLGFHFLLKVKPKLETVYRVRRTFIAMFLLLFLSEVASQDLLLALYFW